MILFVLENEKVIKINVKHSKTFQSLGKSKVANIENDQTNTTVKPCDILEDNMRTRR